MESEKRKYSVPAVDTAFKLLSLLSRKKYQSSTLTEIANALSINPTTCYRVLYELQQQSVVNYDSQNKRYTLGPYLVVLGERAKDYLFDLSLINAQLDKLTAVTGLTSFLVSKVGRNRLAIISKVEGENFGVKVSVGRHFDLIDGAYGKCIVAHAKKEDLEYSLQNNERVKNLDEEELAHLRIELQEVKKNGYAVSYDETIKGIFGVGAPIINFNDEVEMSIAFAGVSAQYDRDELSPLTDLIKNAADEISAQLNKNYVTS